MDKLLFLLLIDFYYYVIIFIRHLMSMTSFSLNGVLANSRIYLLQWDISQGLVLIVYWVCEMSRFNLPQIIIQVCICIRLTAIGNIKHLVFHIFGLLHRNVKIYYVQRGCCTRNTGDVTVPNRYSCVTLFKF